MMSVEGVCREVCRYVCHRRCMCDVEGQEAIDDNAITEITASVYPTPLPPFFPEVKRKRGSEGGGGGQQ